MNLSAYQSLSQRTSQWQPGHPEYRSDRHKQYGAISLYGESGEVVDVLKKVAFSGHALNRAKLVEEAGDVAWSIACICESHGIDLGVASQSSPMFPPGPYMVDFALACSKLFMAIDDEHDVEWRAVIVLHLLGLVLAEYGVTLTEALDHNLAKLAARYPSGSYSDADSQARRDVFPEVPTKPSKVVR